MQVFAYCCIAIGGCNPGIDGLMDVVTVGRFYGLPPSPALKNPKKIEVALNI